jgi:hypothetical protein
VSTYSAFNQSPFDLLSSCDYSGNQPFSVSIPNWNHGEETVVITANKLDSTNKTLTVSLTYGSGSTSNATSLPFGSATTTMAVSL